MFKQALEIDPHFANAWSGLAFASVILPNYYTGANSHELVSDAQEAINKALELDPQNAEAYAARGRIQDRFTHQLAEAHDSYQRAMQLAPNNAGIANLYGDYFTAIGDFKNAEIMERKAAELDPLSAINYSDLAFLYIMMHRHEEALNNARIAADLSPQSADQQDALIVTLIVSGNFNAADELIDRVSLELTADSGHVSRWRCLYYYYLGDRNKLRKTLDLQLQQAMHSDVWHMYTISAFFAMTLDDLDRALPLLEKSWQAKEMLLTWPLYVYLPEQISTDPQWLEFWRRPGLKQTMDMRRQSGSDNTIGYWKRPLQ